MNRQVEERIVAMYFDNQDFEKNAKTTIDTLGQLKKGLDLEDSSKGFEVFEKIGKSLNFEKANQGLRKMKTTIGGMKGAVGNIFKIGQQPLQEAEGALRTLNGYITKYVGFDIAGKIVNGVENAIRQLTVAPVSAGFHQYESTMDSVKTIMSSTGESIDVVSQHLNSMTEYANKTIYSLTDMTSNLGKFTNNGVKLGPAVKAMEGIANATADAGQGAQQASMAMYNISQAIGVGKMTTIDWKSLENANIATVKLKETFLEMAALQGKIEKKVEKDGSIAYMLTKDENGKKLKESIQLTTANFREYLSKGWLDKDTMLRTFEIYSGAIDQTTLESWGIHDKELQEKFMNLGKEALEAATQVRTFTKMMDALKESAQSGWAKSFELIFGNMEQGTALWTTINGELDEVLSKSAEARNSILQIWSGVSHDTSEQEEGIKEKQAAIDELTKKYEKLMATQKKQRKGTKQYDATQKELDATKKSIEDYEREIKNLQLLIRDKKVLMDMEIVDKEGRSGRQILIDALLGKRDDKGDVVETGLVQLLKEIGSAISGAFGDIFGRIDAQGLFDFTQRIADGIHKMVEWFGKLGDKNSRLTKLQKILKGFLGPIKMVVNLLKLGFNLIKRIASPVIDFFIDAFANVSGFFEKLGDLKPGEILEHIGNGLKTAWDKVKKFFSPHEIVDDKGNVTSKEIPFVKWLKDVWEGLKKTVKKWAEENGLGEAWDKISGWWETIKGSLSEGYKALEGIWNNIKKWFNESGIGQFFGNVWEWIKAQFQSSKWDEDERGYPHTGVSKDPPIVSWLKGVWNSVKNFWNDKIVAGGKPIWNAICQFGSNTWEWIKAQFQSSKWDEDERGYPHTGVSKDPPIVSWLKGVWNSVKNFWNDKIVAGGKPIWNAICQFGSNTWEWIKAQFQSSKWDEDERGYPHTGVSKDPPIVSWLKGVWNSVKNFWNDKIVAGGKPIWNAICQFGSNTWEWIKAQFQSSKWDEDERGYPHTGVSKDPPIVSWLKGVWNSVKTSWNRIVRWEGWPAIGNFMSNTWNWILGLFSNNESSVGGASSEAREQAKANAKEAEVQAEAIEESTSFVERIINSITDFVTKIADKLNRVVLPEGLTSFLTNIGDFLAGILKVVGDVLGSAGRIATGKADAQDWLNVTLPLLFTGIMQIFQMLYANSLSKISVDSPTKMFLHLGLGILAIAAAISMIADIPTERLGGAAAIVAVIAVAVGGIFAAIATITTKTAAINPTTPLERFATNLVNKIALIGMLTIALNKIPDIIKAVTDAKKLGVENIGDDVLKILEGVSILMGAVSIIGIVGSKIGSTPGSTFTGGMEIVLLFSAASIVLSLLMSTIGSFSGVVKDVSGADLGYWVEQATTVFEGLGKAIAAFFGSFVGGFIGNAVGSFSSAKTENEVNSLKTAMEVTGSITEADITSFSRVISAISNLQQSLPKPGNIFEWLTGNRLEQLGNQLPALGSGLAGFVTSMGVFQAEDVDKTMESIRMLSLFATSMDTLNSLFGRINNGGDQIHDLLDYPNHPELVQNLDTERLYQYQEAASTLAQIIKDSLTGSDGKIHGIDFSTGAWSIIEAITDALGLGKDAIGFAVRNMINEGLEGINEENFGAHVIKLPNSVKEYYEQLQGTFKTEDGTTIDVGDLIAKAIGSKEQQEQWIGSISGLTTNIETEFSKLKTSYQGLFEDTSWLSTPKMTDEQGQEIDVLSYFQEQLKSISTTINENPIEVKITPVWNFDENFNSDAFLAQLGLQSINLPVGIDAGQMKIDFEGLSNELDLASIRQKLDNIAFVVAASGQLQTQRIDNLGSHMDGIANEVSRLKLYLDTGALVGGIIDDVDTALYDRSMMSARVGSVTGGVGLFS